VSGGTRGVGAGEGGLSRRSSGVLPELPGRRGAADESGCTPGSVPLRERSRSDLHVCGDPAVGFALWDFSGTFGRAREPRLDGGQSPGAGLRHEVRVRPERERRWVGVPHPLRERDDRLTGFEHHRGVRMAQDVEAVLAAGLPDTRRLLTRLSLREGSVKRAV